MARSVASVWLLGSFIVVSALFGIAGCSSSKGYEGGMKTASGLQGTADRIGLAQKQIDQTLSLADSLVNKREGDPRKQFEQFRKSLADLESTAKDVKEAAADMKKRGDDYFARWEKDIATIHNEDVKKVSAERRNERMKQFQDVQHSYQQVADSFRPFLGDLKDIEKALSVELTSGSLDAMKPFVTKAKNDEVPLRQASNDLRQKFHDLGVSMSPVPPKS